MLTDHLIDVNNFQHQLGHGYAGPPRLPDEELALFRLRFLGEELTELGEALGVRVVVTCTPDPELADGPLSTLDRLADALDALVDMDYVLLGTALQLGLGPVYAEAWRRVHTANLLKVAGRKASRGVDGDAVKPADWVAPDLSDLIGEVR
jgi:predicted HAD superfamily Cof-like phosphohydrolase